MKAEGSWWAQKSSGAWLRWSTRRNDWESHPSGPNLPVKSEPDSTEEPQFPWDRWFVRNFPPYSYKRLLLFLVAVVPIAAVIALVKRSPLVVLIGTIAGAFVILPSAYMMARARGHASGDGSPRLARIETVLARPISRVVQAGAVFVVFFGFMFVMLGPGDNNLVIVAGAAALSTLIWMLRKSIIAPILISILGGYVPAIFLSLFSGFMGSGSNLLLTWLFTSLFIAAFTFPSWLGYRKFCERRDVVRS